MYLCRVGLNTEHSWDERTVMVSLQATVQAALCEVHFSKESWFRCGHGFFGSCCSFWRLDPSTKRSQIGIRCSRTNKWVLPEIRNWPLLQRQSLSSSTFNDCYESNRGSFRFTHSISDIPMTPSCSLRSFWNRRLTLWAAHRYRFWNLQFKHRGVQLGM